MVQISRVTLAVAAFFGAAQACWEQCGGQYYTGSTVCNGGCVCTYSNPWYSQCLPSSVTTSSSSTLKSSSSSSSSSSTTPSTTKTSTSSTASASAGPVKYWFSFGDSYTATGFNVAGTLANPANVFGNPAFPGNTACGTVTNWIDQIVVKYNTSYIYAYNFAFSGATIDATLVAPFGQVQSMTDQVNSFLNNLASKPSVPWSGTSSIFSFFIGINDIGNSYSNSGDRNAFSDTLLNAYFALVQKLYNVGARNFLFIDVPPVDRSPYMSTSGATAQANEKSIINNYNTKLQAKIAAFSTANSGTQTWFYDSNARLTQILNSPKTYGFQDATSYGAAAGDVWCNTYHVSPGVHELFAQDIAGILAGSGF